MNMLMKKMYLIVLGIFLILCQFIWVSCDNDDGETDVGRYLYFNSEKEQDTLEIDVDHNFLMTLKVSRSGDLSAAEVPLTVISSDTVFRIPETIRFAEGASNANFTVSYFDALPQKSYSFVLKLEDGVVPDQGGTVTLSRTIKIGDSGFFFNRIDERLEGNRLVLTRQDELMLALGIRRSKIGKKSVASLITLRNDENVFSFPESIEFVVGDSVADIEIPFPEVKSGRDYFFRLAVADEKSTDNHSEDRVCDVQVTVSHGISFAGGGQENVIDIETTGEKILQLEMSRKDVEETISVPVTVLVNEGNFEVPEKVEFAAGESTTTLNILFPDAEIGSYNLKISVQDPEKWFAHTDEAVYQTVVNIKAPEVWETFATPTFTGSNGTFTYDILKMGDTYKMENFMYNDGIYSDFVFTVNAAGGIVPEGGSANSGQYFLGYVWLNSWMYGYLYVMDGFSYIHAAEQAGRLYFQVYDNGYVWSYYDFTW